MGSKPAPDRRRSPRRWLATPVVICYYGARIDAISINISDSGMFLFAAAHLPVGAEIEIEFHVSGEKQSVSRIASIRRRSLYLYAVEFLPITEHAKSNIAADNAGLN